MSDLSPALAQRMARLRASFLARAAGQIDLAEQLIAGLAADLSSLPDLYILLHTLKGSAATFDAATLSQAAERTEGLLADLQHRDSVPGEMIADLDDCVAGMRAALRRVAEGSDGTAETPAVCEAAEPDRGDDKRLIYLCEDDACVAEQLRHQLACFGYDIVLFQGTGDLLKAAELRQPDAVIMDVVLPECEDAAFAAVRDLNAGGRTVPTLFLSATRDFHTRLRAVRAGGEGYLAKPAALVELVEHLDRMTHRVAAEPCRVLVVDDEPDVAAYHALVLEEAGMVAQTVTEPLKVLDLLDEFRPDLVLMDMYMPACSGRELASVIRQIPNFLAMPIVFLSGETDSGKQTLAMGAGADGFLVKPIVPAQLVAQVALRAERMRALRAQMVRDSLTGLLNHNAIKQFLDKELAAARRSQGELCFAMIDVDHFKSVNDSYGHPVGDQVLMALARLLRQQLRTSDVVGRYGGEEFAVILADVDAAAGVRILDGLREDFAKLRFRAGAVEFAATFSSGVAAFPAFATAQSLCEAADRALYEGKRAGRNRVVAAEPNAEGTAP